MAKYSKEFKLKVVLEYLEGRMGYLLLARKHGIRSRALIQRWVHIYNALGEDGLKTIKKTILPDSIQVRCIKLYESNWCFLS